MKIVRVSYAAKPDFVGQNSTNINAVMNDLRAGNYPGINYHCCLGADGRTFTHIAFFQSEDDQKLLNQLPAFLHFQQELKAHGLEIPPQQELLSLVGSTNEFFPPKA